MPENRKRINVYVSTEAHARLYQMARFEKNLGATVEKLIMQVAPEPTHYNGTLQRPPIYLAVLPIIFARI